jgi:putative ABC transport system permease protein
MRIPSVRRLMHISTSRSIEHDVDAELRFHIEARVEDLMRQGRPRGSAEREAQREFGDASAARRELAAIDRRTVRRAGWREWLSSVKQDVRTSLRGLKARPAFTITVLLTLGLGIGANAAVYSVMYAVLLKPLPFGQPNGLVHLWETFEGPVDQRSEASYPDYRDFRDRTRTLTGVAGYQTTGILLGAEHPITIRAGTVTANFFDVLQVRPTIGRAFRTEEDGVGAQPVVVLSDGMWERQFGRNRDAIGSRIVLDGRPAAVIGVLPPSFQFGGRASSPDVWIPIKQDDLRESRGSHWINFIGRMKPGVEVAAVTRDVSAIMDDLAREFPQSNAKRHAVAVPLRDELVGSLQTLLIALYIAVAVVLLVACTNVANLMLMRATDREREMAVRVALGAGRGRLVRQLLTESVVLAFGGGALALVVARVGIKAIIGVVPDRTLVSIPGIASAGIDGGLVAYLALVSFLAALVFGLVPAFRATRTSIHDFLKQGARGSSSRAGLRDGLVVAEIALTVVLVSGASLFGKSLRNLLAIDAGFRAEHVATAGILLSRQVADDPVRATGAFDRLDESVRKIPGVESVGLISRLPMNAGESGDFEIAGRPRSAPGQRPSGTIRKIGGEYFKTLGIALRRGRIFASGDRDGAPKVVIVNEALVRAYFPSVDPLGQGIIRSSDTLRVIGVVRDVAIGSVDAPVPPTWYVPLAQSAAGFMRVAVRTTRDDTGLFAQMSTALGAIDPNAAMVEPVSMDDLVNRSSSVFARRFPLILIGAFAGMALVLALVGIYGVVSYSVGQQRRELGIRMALGADARGVVGLFLRRSALIALIGAVGGIVAAIVSARFVAGMLYGVAPSDPVTYVGASVLLAGASLVATFVPAMRAARVDPTITLRSE